MQANLTAAQNLRKGIADLNAEQARARVNEVRDQEAAALLRIAAIRRELTDLERSGQRGTEEHASATVELARANSELLALGQASLLLSNRYGDSLNAAATAAGKLNTGVETVVGTTNDVTSALVEATARTVKWRGAVDEVVAAFARLSVEQAKTPIGEAGRGFVKPKDVDTTVLRGQEAAGKGPALVSLDPEINRVVAATVRARRATEAWSASLRRVGFDVRALGNGFRSGVQSAVDDSSSALAQRFARALSATETSFEQFGQTATNILGMIAGRALFARQSIRGLAKELDVQGKILNSFFGFLFSQAGRAVGGNVGAKIGAGLAPDYSNRIQAAPELSEVRADLPPIVVPVGFDVAGAPSLPVLPSLSVRVGFDVAGVPDLPRINPVEVPVGFDVDDAPALPALPALSVGVGFDVPGLPVLPTPPDVVTGVRFDVPGLPIPPDPPAVVVPVGFDLAALALPAPPAVLVPVGFDVAGLPALPTPPALVASVGFDVPGLPALPTPPGITAAVRFDVPSLPALPVPPEVVAPIGFDVAGLPALPEAPSLTAPVGFDVAGLPSLPEPAGLTAAIGFDVARLPALPTPPGLVSRIGFDVAGLPAMPTPPDLVSRIDFALSPLPTLPKIEPVPVNRLQPSVSEVRRIAPPASTLPNETAPTAINVGFSMGQLVAEIRRYERETYGT